MPQQSGGAPYDNQPQRIRSMFGAIAARYDTLNAILSFNRHQAWRRYAIGHANLEPGDTVVDVCAGTGDFVDAALHHIGPSGRALAVDFCRPMLELAMGKPQVAGPGTLVAVGDATALPCASDIADCITIGFGIRNVQDRPAALREFARVLRPGGRLVCLEFSLPRNPLLRSGAVFYERTIIPLIGGSLARREAYAYLGKSISKFATREELAASMEEAGLKDVEMHDLNLGAVCVHIGTKR